MFDFDYFKKLIELNTGVGPNIQMNILSSIMILIILFIIRFIINKILAKKITDPRKYYKWQKIVSYSTVALAGILIARVWFSGVTDIATYLGITSAGLAVALKDPITNVAAWFYIVGRKVFSVGDRIQIGELQGDVIDQQISMFVMLEIGNWVHADQPTGRIMIVPNGRVFTEHVANFSRDFNFIWNELPVIITFESNWEKAHKILTQIAKTHSHSTIELAEQSVKKIHQKMIVYYSKLESSVFVRVIDYGVELTIRYLTEPRKRRITAEQIWMDVLREVAKEDDIDFAYPTTRFYFNQSEGKDGTKPVSQTLYRPDIVSNGE